MNYDLNKLDYSIAGEGKPLLFLHGWGGSRKSFSPVIEHLPRTYKMITLSIPGFGESPEPDVAWSVQDYADLVSAFLDAKLTPEERAQLLCVTHSYGGRLAGKIKKFKKLVQIASAGIKPERTVGYHVRLAGYKFLKFLANIPVAGMLFRRPHLAHRRLRGSDDYQNASPVMQRALTMAVNHDQRKDFAEITCPTLIIWGDADTTTPIEMGRTMEQLIKDSAMVVYPEATHQVYLEHAKEISIIIDYFFSAENTAQDDVKDDVKSDAQSSALNNGHGDAEKHNVRDGGMSNAENAEIRGKSEENK